MNSTTKALLRVLDRQEQATKRRERRARELAAWKSALHTRYVAYKAKQEAER